MKRPISVATCFFILLGMTSFLTGCCQLGFTCYELYVFGRPPFVDAEIYLDGKLIKSSVTGSIVLMIPYKKHELKVIQKGYKPFVAVLEGGPGRFERSLQVKFDPIDSVPPTPSQSDTAKTVK